MANDSSLADSSLAGNSAESPLEILKHVDPDGNEFWSARELRPILGYTTWRGFSSVLHDVYSSLSLENPYQTEMRASSIRVQIGLGVLREIKDWRLSASALDRVLSRAASHKPQAVRALRRHNDRNLRIEIEIGAGLYDFCESAGLAISHQRYVGNRIFDYCIAEQLLIEVDEAQHQHDPLQRKQDRVKDALALHYGYQLLRIKIPADNLARVCGKIIGMLSVFPDQTFSDSTEYEDSPWIARSDYEDHGFRGLYNGLTEYDIRKRKKLRPGIPILRQMGAEELAANLFRFQQAQRILRRENIQGRDNINRVHYETGVVVRRAIAKIGGIMPEDLPALKSIQQLEKAKKKRLASKNK
jgi:very-short-patch-repair endonuclease